MGERVHLPADDVAAPCGPPLTRTPCETARLYQRLLGFYATYRPSREHEIEELMLRPVTEARLFHQLYVEEETSVPQRIAPQQPPTLIPARSEVEMATLRDRLTRFYQEHCPENLDKVDAALNMNVNEDLLFDILRKKYVEKVPVMAVPIRTPEETDRLRARLACFYQEHCPENLGKVDAALHMNVSEDELFDILRKKYVEKVPVNLMAVPIRTPEETDRLRARLTSFYQEHCPENLGKVDAALHMNVSEDLLFDILRKKYATKCS